MITNIYVDISTHDGMFTAGAEYLADVMTATGKNVKFAASFILAA